LTGEIGRRGGGRGGREEPTHLFSCIFIVSAGMTATVKHGETGFLYPPGDVNKCVTYLLSLIENAELRSTISKYFYSPPSPIRSSPLPLIKQIRAARKDAEEWGWDKATRQLVEVYEETIEKCKQYKVKQL
jgi:glycosyltransferase involved in cell wall biosynthesis